MGWAKIPDDPPRTLGVGACLKTNPDALKPLRIEIFNYYYEIISLFLGLITCSEESSRK
jgi:hypothetical protein